MNNFHYHQDPLYAAASSILGGTTPLNEGVEDVKAIVDTLKVGDTTNFGKVLEIGPNSITFKAKDLPKTTIAFNQRKMGSSEFLLLKTIKLKEETELEEEDVAEAYKPLRKPADLIDELQSIVNAPDSKLWDVTSVSIRLSHEDIFDRFPKIYDYVEDMWFEIMQPNGAKKTKEIAKKAIEAVRKYYPDLNKSQKSNPVYKEEESIEEEIKRVKYDVVIAKLKDGIWDTSYDVKPRTHLEVTDNKTKKSMTIFVEDILQEADDFYTEGVNDFKSLIGKQVLHGSPGYPTKEVIASVIPHQTKKGSFEVEFKSGAFDVLSQGELNDLMNGVEVFYKSPHGGRSVIELQEEKNVDEAINWLGDYLTTSEKSQLGGYRPTILNKKTKRVMYQSAVRYNTPQEAKDHAEDYLKQKSKGIKEPKLPHVGTYKEESDCSDEKMNEATPADAALKRRKQVDMARVNAGVMSRDDYNKKYKLGKYRPAGSKLSGPGGVYKNLVKEEESLEEAVPTPAVQKLIVKIDEMSPKDYLVFLQALADNAQGIANMSQSVGDGKSNAKAWATVADHISAAADAYAKRPVRMENIEVEGESLEEAARSR
jgi:hypothetical protein